MRLTDSQDPARGDPADPRRAYDGKHRNHRILAANQHMPLALDLDGAKEQIRLVEEWLRGDTRVPEIQDRWAEGPVVPLKIVAPESARPGERLRVRVTVTNNKAGHNFPTGPLDLIESWVEFVAEDASGRVVFHSGLLDKDMHVEAGSLVFKSEGIDRHGQLIDRHNLWNMVGARFKRAVFPGYTDTFEYEFVVPKDASDRLRLRSRLRYRKLSQLFIDRAIGKGAFTAPITDVSQDKRSISVLARGVSSPAPGK